MKIKDTMKIGTTITIFIAISIVSIADSNTVVQSTPDTTIPLIPNLTSYSNTTSVDKDLTIIADIAQVTVDNQTHVKFSVFRYCGTEPDEVCIQIYPPPLLPVSGADVQFNGVASGSGITNSEGDIIIPITAVEEGTIIVTASKDGYISSSITLYAILPVNETTATPTPNETTEVTVTPTPNETTEVTVTPTPNETTEVTVTPTPNETTEVTVTPTPNETTEVTVTPTPTQEPTCANRTIHMERITTIVGDNASFGLDFTPTRKTWNITWYVNDLEVSNQPNVSNITEYVNTTSSEGEWTVTVVATKGCDITTYVIPWTVNPKPSMTTKSSSPSSDNGGGNGNSGGGGGSGGGVITAESYNNIINTESKDRDLAGGKPVTYTFTTSSNFSVYEVVVTGKANEGDVTMRLEHLRNVSSLVNRNPAGIIYANENIWSSSKRIDRVIIRYKVSNSWLTANNANKEDIKLLRFDNGWKKLNARLIKTDANYTYFESTSTGLSAFAVSALKESNVSNIASLHIPEDISIENPNINSPNTNRLNSTSSEVKNNTSNEVPGFKIIAVIGMIIVTYILIRRTKNTRR